MRQFVRLFDRLFARFFLVLYFFLASLSEKNCVVHQRRSQDLCFYPNISCDPCLISMFLIYRSNFANLTYEWSGIIKPKVY